MADVVLDNVCKRYDGGGYVVDHFSLEVFPGEFLVLVGPSGCGKSTTLRMIAGLEEISAGALSIGGTCMNAVPPKDRDIAMVFQNYALYPHMTVFENMAFGLRLRGVPKPEIARRVQEAADILNVAPLLNRLPKQLSGGQRQRVAVGRAIVRKPKVFLFDEPLSNLDAKMRVDMRNEISRLHRRLNATMIYVTHDQVEAMTMGDRIVVMNRGKVQQVDRPLDVYRSPANVFVAGFIGTPPINLLRGRLAAGAVPARAFRFGGGVLPVPDEFARLFPSHDGQEVFCGLRPESLRAPTAGASGAALTGRADIVEPLGAETFLHLVLDDGSRVTARVGADFACAPGARVTLAANMGQALFFDAVTERRL